MKKINPQIPVIIGYFFVLLFCYAAVSKLLDFENFQLQLAQSPLLSAFAGITSYAVIIIEFAISLLLCVSKTRLLGLYASLSLMSGFTIYIFLILYYSDFIPCSCGGILEKLGWTEHLIFNIGCVILAIIGIILYEKKRNIRLIRSVLLCSITTASSCIIVTILFSSSEYIIKKDNNFTRRFLLHPILQEKFIDLALNSYYFAGISNGKIFLGNVTAPLLITAVDTSLKKIQAVKIHLDTSDHRFRNIQLQVKDSNYYLYDGSIPIIYRGTLGDTIAYTISHQDAFFTQLAIVDSINFIIRTQSSQNRRYMLASLNLIRKPKLQMYPSILEKQVDGVFDVVGKLAVTNNTDEVLYTYTYRNQILVMDKNLNILRRLHTIDTTTIAKIQERRLSDGTHKMSAPPLKVNGEQASHRNLLFIHSSLKGRHESSKMWKKNSVVDIYHTDKQEYIGSFYLANKDETTFSHMIVDDHYLYVLIKNELKRYRFREPISKYFN